MSHVLGLSSVDQRVLFHDSVTNDNTRFSEDRV